MSRLHGMYPRIHFLHSSSLTVVSGFLTPKEVEAANAASAPYFDVTPSTQVKNQDLVEMGVDFHASVSSALSLLSLRPFDTERSLGAPSVLRPSSSLRRKRKALRRHGDVYIFPSSQS